jgi:hypothetical protein
MCRILKIIAASLVLLCVLAIFIAPTIDLPDAAMRGRPAWSVFLLFIGAILLYGWLPALGFLLNPYRPAILLVFDPDLSRSQLTC